MSVPNRGETMGLIGLTFDLRTGRPRRAWMAWLDEPITATWKNVLLAARAAGIPLPWIAPDPGRPAPMN